ncbi:Eef2k [Symbiodinium pilosum]|uniref:Eef2k protein n=1 Tax=Symbiodinium pilosum TaxID=2952 RepID=A0A812L565_SYMPI|nr:Eef2k [Symbiodinium pilosum]
MDHSDFLPQVCSTDAERWLCLALLRMASNLGILAAHGALARLLVDGVYSERSEESLLLAASCLEKFALESAEAGESDMKEPLKHEVCCKHGCVFGWDSHGWQPHSAFARAAELYENELRSQPGSWAKSRELWSSAAECALEDPKLAKQAMRYTEKAELEEPEADNAPVVAEDTQHAAGDGLVICLQGDLRERFQQFAAAFASPEHAVEHLLQLFEQAVAKEAFADGAMPVPEAKEECATDVAAPLKEAEVDEDVWALLG